jgi:hypothetical protein
VWPGGECHDAATGLPADTAAWTGSIISVDNANQAHPLTSKAKFKLSLRTSFDIVQYPYMGFLAGISQASNSEPGFGQGASGYGKLFGAYFADNAIVSLWTTALFPSLFHQDPRYYRLGKGRFFHRLGYAVNQQFITRSDLKHKEFNFSEIVGSAISAGIANAYHPSQDRTFANTMSVWWTQVTWDTMVNVLKEFWPDIQHKTGRHKITPPQP